MKKAYYCIIVLCVLAFTGNAQTVNLNPDKEGEPWIAGGVPIEEFNQELAKQVELKLKTRKISLPYMVDNSTSIYFRPIFNQADGSCAQASGIGYHYTYEVNRIRGLASNTAANQYPSHFTYNFLNDGSGENGSWYYEGWDIVKEIGVPTVEEYGGMSKGGADRWLSGYDIYYSGMHNRVKEYYSINIRNEDGLNTLKRYLYDHGNGQRPGGLANFSVYSDPTQFGTLPVGTEEAGKKIITQWGSDGGHALTIVGYNDNIKYDFNGDGEYTNDVDINGDYKVDMKDWEIGAVKFANSWGTSWGNDGFCYLPYRLLALNSGNGGISSDYVFTIEVRRSYSPTLTAELDLNYTSRKNLKIYAGLINSISGVAPMQEVEFFAFTNKGGDFYMQGGKTVEDKKHISIGLDISSLKSKFTAGSKIALYLHESDPAASHVGTIERCVIHDHSAGIDYDATPVNYPIYGIRNVVVVNSTSYTPPEITDTELPLGESGKEYSYNISATDGKAPYVWAIDEAYRPVPPGMHMDENGAFYGTPVDTAAHNWKVRFELTDANSIKTGVILDFELEGDYTGIDEEFMHTTQPYPNPFHHTVRMEVELEKTLPLKVEVFNTSGEMLKLLENSRLPKGVYSIQWSPEGKPSGVYFIKITKGKSSKTYPILYAN